MAAFFASCNDEETGKETKWFYAPEAGVSGTTVEVSCRTKFGDGVLSSAQAGFAYAPIRSDDTGSFTETTDVTVDGQVMSCRLTGLDAETSYLIYAYVDMGSGGRMQSKPVVVKTGVDPVLPDDPRFGVSDCSQVTASSATVSCTFDYTGGKEVSEAYFLCGTTSDDGQRVAVTTEPGAKSATLTGLSASTEYKFRLCVVVGGETFGSTVGTFATSAAGGGDDRTKYAGWAELPVENGIQSDYYYAYHMRNDAAKIRNFSVCYSAKYRCPVWVAAPMHKSYVGSAKRKDNYINDPKISCTQNTEYDFKSTNLTRGHMLGSSDRTVSQATNDQVFYKSNIGPQLQNGFNTGGGVWNNCEDWVDTQWKGQADTTYQVIGCYWENESKKVNGTVVPTHYYKVLLRIKNHVNKWVVECSRDELQCVAICFPHNSSNGGTKPSQYVAKGFVMSVADLEKKTGQTFFANVPNAPKDTYNASDWGL